MKNSIQSKITERIGSLKGNYQIYYIDLKTEIMCNIGNNDRFPASGMVKIMALVEYFNQLDRDLLNKDSVYKLQASDYLKDTLGVHEPDYGVLNYLREGRELTLEELSKIMITVSDNVAFNILCKTLGAENINKTMEGLGFASLKINRLIFESQKIKEGINNYLSVSEMGELLFRLYHGQIVSSASCREIISLMTLHQRSNIIPYYFMEKVPIAHQTSFDAGLIFDMGIVLTDAPFILCMGIETEDTRKAENIMRDITQICHLNSQSINEKEQILNKYI